MAKHAVSPEEIVGQVLESDHIDVLREILAKALGEIMVAEVQVKWTRFGGHFIPLDPR